MCMSTKRKLLNFHHLHGKGRYYCKTCESLTLDGTSQSQENTYSDE